MMGFAPLELLIFLTQGDYCPIFLYQIMHILNLYNNRNKFIKMQQSHKWLENKNSIRKNNFTSTQGICPSNKLLFLQKITRTPQIEVKKPTRREENINNII